MGIDIGFLSFYIREENSRLVQVQVYMGGNDNYVQVRQPPSNAVVTVKVSQIPDLIRVLRKCEKLILKTEKELYGKRRSKNEAELISMAQRLRKRRLSVGDEDD